VFVLPTQSLGETHGERVLFQDGKQGQGDFRSLGTVTEWRESVGRLCAGNSRPMLAIGLAFAAPLLHLINEEPGGVHVRGDSSCGKSTALWAAASVYGAPQGDHSFRKEWRATSNGLEALAVSRNDALLVLDEMGQVEGSEAGNIAYMLANGQPKARAGDWKKVPTWRLLFLSSGEISLADHMATAGKKIKAGQETRLADIQADAGAGLGVFDQLNGCANGEALSVAIREAANRYHGAVGLAFIEHATRERDNLPAKLRTVIEAFTKENVPSEASGQVRRVAKRFGLIAAALELAGEWGLTGWQPGLGTWAAQVCFADWLTQRGGAGNQEESAILKQVRAFFEIHGESRFSNWRELPTENGGTVQLDSPHPTINRVGFKRRNGEGFTYYVFPEAFKTEICAGLDANKAAQLLKEKGWIIPDKQGKTTQGGIRLPGISKQCRCYVFTLKMWE
jgi:putative DNA primase/helicase